MGKLIFGRNGQVRFNSEEEKKIAIDYILTSSNVQMSVEDNQEQGAWGQEHRIIFKSSYGVPECLLKNMTKGNGGCFGRINCKDFFEEIQVAKALRKTSQSTKPSFVIHKKK